MDPRFFSGATTELITPIKENEIKGMNTMVDYCISTDKSLLNINSKKICALLSECFWSKNVPIEYVERFIKYSLCFGIYKKDANELVGFGRVISDYTTYAYVCDIIIAPLHRKHGLGSLLIKEIMSHPELQGLKTWALRTTDEARKIYEKNGFKLADHPETQLEINDLEIYSTPQFKNLHSNNEASLRAGF